MPSTEVLAEQIKLQPAVTAEPTGRAGSQTATPVRATVPAANPAVDRRLPPPDLSLPRAPAQTIDVSFVSDDFVAAVALRPRELLAAPLMAGFVPADKVAAWAAGFALDPRQVEHALILAGTPHAKTGPAVGMVLRCRTPVNQAKVIAALAPAHDEVLYGDKAYLRNQEFSGQSICFVDDRTLVVAQQVQLERMLRAAGEPSPLIDRLRQLDAQQPLAALLTFDPIRELIQEELARSPAMPPPFDQFDALPVYLSAVELRLDPTKLPLALLTLEARDAAAAQRLEPLAHSALAIFRGWLMRGMARPQDDPQAFAIECVGRNVTIALGTHQRGAEQLIARLFSATQPGQQPVRTAVRQPAGAGQLR
jgi:hypothetical protein